VHVNGSVGVLSAAWPHLVGQGYGRVVNVCSLEGVLIGSAGFEVYDAAKGGLMGLTRSLAVDRGTSRSLGAGLFPRTGADPGECGRVQRLPPVHSQRESRPPMTCALFRLAPGHKGVTRDGNCPGL
jgi:short chain dehydrogenase